MPSPGQSAEVFSDSADFSDFEALGAEKNPAWTSGGVW